MRPKSGFYSADTALHAEIRVSVDPTRTIGDFIPFLQTFRFPVPARLILETVSYLSERMLNEEGKPDRSRIAKRARILNGPRLTLRREIDLNAFHAILRKLEDYIPEYGSFGEGNDWRACKEYKASSPLDLAVDIMHIIGERFHEYESERAKKLPDTRR